jgi:hypothetical protein
MSASSASGLPLTQPPALPEPETDGDSPRQRGPTPEGRNDWHEKKSQRNKLSTSSFGSVKEAVHPRSIWKPVDKDVVLMSTGCLCHVRSRWGVNLLNAMQFPNGAFQ